MKISEIINYVDQIKPNAFSPLHKTMWLNEVEAMVQTDVMLLAPSSMVTYVYESSWSGTVYFPDMATMVCDSAPGFHVGGTVTISELVDAAVNNVTAKILAVSSDGLTLTFAEGTFTAADEEAATLQFDGSSAEMLVGAAHHKIYYTYLMAMIDFANGEYQQFQNTITLFNRFFTNFTMWYRETYHPADGEAVELGYYLSAYAIAVKHGYVGTEEEWLASLQGDRAVSTEEAQAAAAAAAAYAATATDKATEAAASATNASISATAANAAQTAAQMAQSSAETAEGNAVTAATNAANSAVNTATLETSATNAAAMATTQATAAENSASSAASSAASASTSANAANTAQTAAQMAQSSAETAEGNAATAATNAANSATTAATLETSATNAADTATMHATAAENSASAAATSATSASTSAIAANTAQSAAQVAQSSAETAEGNAETAATNAASSASAASASAANAASSASAAATSAMEAEVNYSIDGDRVGFKKGDEAVYTYTDHLTGLQGEQGIQGDQGIQGIQGVQGEIGETGDGIASVIRTSGNGSPGTTDTYTITMTSGATASFTVYNGSDAGITVDAAMSATSTNPVQNKIVKAALDEITIFKRVGSIQEFKDLWEDTSESLKYAIVTDYLELDSDVTIAAYGRVVIFGALPIQMTNNGSITISGTQTYPELSVYGGLSISALSSYTFKLDLGDSEAAVSFQQVGSIRVATTLTAGTNGLINYQVSHTAIGGSISGGTVYNWCDVSANATSTMNGFMSSSDKSKLDGLSMPTIDAALSDISTNPVQNQVVKAAIDGKADTSSLASVATSGIYNDLTGKPSALSGFTDDLGSSPTHTHSQYITDVSDKADLVDGTVPSSQLPSYVDDVLEVADYASLPVTGESGKIYITLDTNKTYRWSGSGYVEISESLALGETSSTAYRGDRGATAYNHSQTTGNPHSVTKSDVGLGNVDNTSDVNKPISTATQTALNGKQKTITSAGWIIGSAVSVSTSTSTVLNSITIDAGTYLIFGNVMYVPNSSGFRGIRISTSSSYAPDYGQTVNAVNGTYTSLFCQRLLTFAAASTIYLTTFQNSGSTLNVTIATLYAIKIS